MSDKAREFEIKVTRIVTKRIAYASDNDIQPRSYVIRRDLVRDDQGRPVEIGIGDKLRVVTEVDDPDKIASAVKL